MLFCCRLVSALSFSGLDFCSKNVRDCPCRELESIARSWPSRTLADNTMRFHTLFSRISLVSVKNLQLCSLV